MSNISDYLENKWLDMIRGQSYTAPAAVYVQLHTGAPGDAGTSNISAIHTSANTARVAVTFSAASGGSMSSSAAVDFTSWPSAGNNETISHISIWDSTGVVSSAFSSSNGNCLWNGSITGGSKTLTTGDTLSITSLTLTLA